MIGTERLINSIRYVLILKTSSSVHTSLGCKLPTESTVHESQAAVTDFIYFCRLTPSQKKMTVCIPEVQILSECPVERNTAQSYLQTRFKIYFVNLDSAHLPEDTTQSSKY